MSMFGGLPRMRERAFRTHRFIRDDLFGGPQRCTVCGLNTLVDSIYEMAKTCAQRIAEQQRRDAGTYVELMV